MYRWQHALFTSRQGNRGSSENESPSDAIIISAVRNLLNLWITLNALEYSTTDTHVVITTLLFRVDVFCLHEQLFSANSCQAIKGQ